MNVSTSSRILVVKTHALGDVLMTTPAVAALRQRFPEATITYLTSEVATPVLDGNPDISDVMTIDSGALFRKQVWKLPGIVRDVRERKFNVAYIFQASIPIHGLIWTAGVPEIFGFSLKRPSPFLHKNVRWEPRAPLPSAAKFMKLVAQDHSEAHGEDQVEDHKQYRPILTASRENQDAAREKLQTIGVDLQQPILVVCPGGGRNIRDRVDAKRLPVETFAAAINATLPQFKGWQVVLAGDRNDAVVTKSLEWKLGDFPTFHWPAGPLSHFIGLVSAASAVLTNDSFPVHLAQASRKPCTVVCGPSDDRAILPALPETKVVRSPLSCAPCYANEPFFRCIYPDHPRCMEAVYPKRIQEALAEVLRRAT